MMWKTCLVGAFFAILRGKCGKLAGLSWPFRTIASGLCYSKGVVEKLANHWTGARNNWQEYWWNNMQTLWTPHLPIIRRTPLQKNMPILIMKHNVIEFELLRTLVMNQCAPICGTDSWRSRERNYTYEPMSMSWCSCFEVVEAAEVISWPESHFPTPPLGSNRPCKTYGRREMALGELE